MCTFILAPIIGHVGDGNFHSLIMIDPNNEHELAAAKELAHRMAQYVQQQYNCFKYIIIFRRAMAVGGTCTGEHGIGHGKRSLLEEEIGTVGIETMKTIKKALDPNGIMNPGKIFKTF